MSQFHQEPLPIAQQRQVAKLVKVYKLAYLDVLKILKDIPQGFSRRRLQQKAGLIDRRLRRLDKNTKKWLNKETPRAYKDGIKQAVTGFKGGKLKYRFGRSLTTLDEKALKMAIRTSYVDFGQAIQTVRKKSIQSMEFALKEQLQADLGVGIAEGATQKQIANKLKKSMLSRGVVGLVDRKGRTWELDSYAEMLSRTKIMDARNSATVNRTKQEGYDLVKVSTHSTDCELCSPWEGKILSLSGEGKYPAYEKAIDAGLMHPNCGHVITPYHDI